MRDHWYCGNIPPRQLDDKRKDFEFGGKKEKDKTSLDQSESFLEKSGSFFFKKRERRQKVSGRGLTIKGER